MTVVPTLIKKTPNEKTPGPAQSVTQLTDKKPVHQTIRKVHRGKSE